MRNSSRPQWTAPFAASVLAIAMATGAALADTDTARLDAFIIGEITYGEDLLDKEREYGSREFEVLNSYVRDAVEREAGDLESAASPAEQLTLNVTIEDAVPNRPTMQQTTRRGMHWSSVNRGGADLSGELIDADGNVVETFEYDWQSRTLRDSSYGSTWSDARRTINRFADRVGDYVEERQAAQ